MFNQEEIREILQKNPEDFHALYLLACDFRQKHNYSACFAMADRAIASYESTPVPGEQSKFFDMKRLHAQMLREHMEEIIGPCARIIDSRWLPVFKLGRPRELALCVDGQGTHLLGEALSAPQLKRLRYLSIIVNDHSDEAVKSMADGRFDTLRALNLTFLDMPDIGRLKALFEAKAPQFKDIVSFKIHLPQISDELAFSLRESFQTLEYLNFYSTERCITENFCEYLADDPRSKYLMRLGIVGSLIGDKGLFAIFSSENFTALQVLDVHDGIMTNNAARIILEARSLPVLRSIDLRYNQIDPAGLDMLHRIQVTCDASDQHRRPVGVN